MLKESDLVELSAYGKKIKMIQRLRNDVGLILKVDHNNQTMYVKWSKGGFGWVNRRDIKKVRSC